MKKLDGFDYRKAEADLDNVGDCHPDEIYSYHSEKAVRGYMKEHGLNPDKYYNPDRKNTRHGSNDNDDCYLTTACVAARGLPDTCTELQTLRAFRDGVLACRPNGQEDIEEYYRMAPGIVASINQREDAKQIWDRVYAELVEPCMQMIHEGKDDEAQPHLARHQKGTVTHDRSFFAIIFYQLHNCRLNSAVITDLPEMLQPCLYKLRTVGFYHTQQFAQGAFRNARHIVAQEGLAGTCDPNLCRIPSRVSLGNVDMNRFKGIGFI